MSLLDRGQKYKETGGRIQFEEREYDTILKEVRLEKSQNNNDKFVFEFKIVEEGDLYDTILKKTITITKKTEKFATDELAAIAIDLGGKRFMVGMENVLELRKVFARLDDYKRAKCKVNLKYEEKNPQYYKLRIIEIEAVLDDGSEAPAPQPVSQEETSPKMDPLPPEEQEVQNPFSSAK